MNEKCETEPCHGAVPGTIWISAAHEAEPDKRPQFFAGLFYKAQRVGFDPPPGGAPGRALRRRRRAPPNGGAGAAVEGVWCQC